MMQQHSISVTYIIMVNSNRKLKCLFIILRVCKTIEIKATQRCKWLLHVITTYIIKIISLEIYWPLLEVLAFLKDYRISYQNLFPPFKFMKLESS